MGLPSDSYAVLVPLSAVRRLQADASSGGELRAGCNRRDISGVASGTAADDFLDVEIVRCAVRVGKARPV